MSPHTWVVSPSGLDANFSNLRDAFGNASSGDTLLVLPGTYGYEFNCGLSLGGRNLTVRGSGSGARSRSGCVGCCGCGGSGGGLRARRGL